MKNKMWLLQVPLIALFASAYHITQLGESGDLHDEFLRDKLYPSLRTVAGTLTNIKFRIRGPEAPKNKVVIVAVDSEALETVGRWPWHRDMMAYLVQRTFDWGAKVVGLDAVFSEPDTRVPDQLKQVLKEMKLGALADSAETDPMFAQAIHTYRDRLVLGWTTESACQPAYMAEEECPVTHPDAIAMHPQNFARFAYSKYQLPLTWNPSATPLMSLVTFIPNLPMYNDAARHQGYFNAYPDADGYIRRTAVAMFANSVPYPSLALEMARVGMDEELGIQINAKNQVDYIKFMKSDRRIPVSSLGTLQINFRGPTNAFPYISAVDVMRDEPTIEGGIYRQLASSSKTDILKDAYVLIGVTALGVHDMRAFPFDSNTPGVEGHATILDNILANDALILDSAGYGEWIVLFLMIVGAGGFAYATQRLESVPALVLFILVISGVGIADFKFLFAYNNISWNTSFLYLEMISIFFFTLAVKYVMEEKNKKFIKGAFAKYVAPAIVDSMLKDPTKLTVGGEKRELTILFSDIRGFTTLSERMDAPALAKFLNEYLGVMTDIVFATEGTLDKYIGDAVMAFWGAPVKQEKHAANALKGAIRMIQALDKLRPELLEKYGADVQIGIGVNSGAVNVGNMGSETIFEYTVIGDNVNLASRLEGLTKPYGAQIVTTRFTFDYVEKCGEPLPPHRVLDFVKVKGKNKAVELIEVFAKDPSPDGVRMFEEARVLYTQQKWDEAIARFRQADETLRAAPDTPDGPSQMYIERCEEFKLNPPEAGWDGSWKMTSK